MNRSDTPMIMVIGDDSHFCYLMRRYVWESAHQLIFANLHENALALARQAKPDAIVLEVGSPGTLGWDVLHALQADEVTGHIPVLVCSWQEEQKPGTEAGAKVHLRMPILFDDFQAALDTIGLNHIP
jgi:CheY-like chemotaxis protein